MLRGYLLTIRSNFAVGQLHSSCRTRVSVCVLRCLRCGVLHIVLTLIALVVASCIDSVVVYLLLVTVANKRLHTISTSYGWVQVFLVYVALLG